MPIITTKVFVLLRFQRGVNLQRTSWLLGCILGIAAVGANAVVVEYFDPDLNNFFITADPTEQAFVDSGAVGRWQRTGNTFTAGGLNQVCRFCGNSNINPASRSIYGPNSHFYTADPAECAGVKATYTPNAKSWKFESNDFLTSPVVNGGCPSGLVPVYRAYNNGFARGIDSNHRITSNFAAYQQTIAAGSIGEGIVMCAPPPDLRGIYVLDGYLGSTTFPGGKAADATLTAALNVPGVDGLLVVLGWSDVEPAMGHYTWDILDQWISTAVASGKKVELSIAAAYYTPPWLFQPAPGGGGAKPLFFSFTRKPKDTTCLTATIAAPWDPAFQVQWDAMLSAVAAHLKSAGTYGALSILRLTGINKDTGELHLPEQAGSDVTCVTNSVATWQQAGYRPSLLLQGWDGITSAFKKNFSDKSFSVAIIASAHPFPAIAEDGSVITGTIPNQNLPLLTLASQKLPGQLVIQNLSLYTNSPAQPETIQSAQNLNTMIAFQTNEDVTGQGAICGARGDTVPVPCTAATYLTMLQTGIYPLGQSDPLRAQYIEVFAVDTNTFPAAILEAHNELMH